MRENESVREIGEKGEKGSAEKEAHMPNAHVSRFNLRCLNGVHSFPNRHVIPHNVFFCLHASCFHYVHVVAVAIVVVRHHVPIV